MPKKNDMVPRAQYGEVIASIISCMPKVTVEEMQQWVRLPARVKASRLKGIFDFSHGDGLPYWQVEWTRFYREVFKLKVNFSSVVPPAEKEGYNWLVVIAKELGDEPMSTAMAVAKELFPTWQDMDKAVSTNDRDPSNGSYAIRLRDRVEADEENKNLSADIIAEQNIAGVTLLERILLELFFFWKKGNHLDIHNWTL